ncbi:MAG: hypothetical protein K6G26_00185 [Lachnospiraceae bacterium]|nr:hypothetical protein [Lachnospiraceae bacterium]
MGIFRSKNAKMYTMIMAIAAIVMISFGVLVKNKDKEADNKETVIDNTELSRVLNKELSSNYPATPREVVKYYCKILKCFFNENLTEEQFLMLIDKERELFDDELLKQNEYGSFVQNRRDEVANFKKDKKSIINYVVDDSENVKTWYNDDKECASLLVRINISGSELIIKDEQFLFRRDKNNNWKILGWKDADVVDISE